MVVRRAPGRPARLVAPGFVLLAIAGAWLAHTLEYLRVWGTEGLAARLAAPEHAWMLPVGGGLLVLAAAGGALWVRLHRRLGEALDGARARLARGLRSGVCDARRHVPVARPSLGARLGATWLLLAVCITGLYLTQENVEAAAAGVPIPGLGPVSGAHAAAPLVVAAVAFVLAACVVECRRRVATVARRVERVERLLAALVRDRHRQTAPRAAREKSVAHLDRLGAQLWSRPPPLGQAR